MGFDQSFAETVEKVWYKEWGVWLVLAPILLVFIVSSITVTIAFKTKDDTVVDNYYKEGRLIDRRFAAEQMARQMALSAEVIFDVSSQEIFVQLSSDIDSSAINYPSLNLFISHPSNANKDSVYILNPVGDGRYRADFSQTYSGLQYLRLTAARSQEKDTQEYWRLSGDIYLEGQARTFLTP